MGGGVTEQHPNPIANGNSLYSSRSSSSVFHLLQISLSLDSRSHKELRRRRSSSEAMKLSFSLPSKSSSKPNLIKPPPQTSRDRGEDEDRNQTHQEFVTEFDPSKTLTSHTNKHKIPRLEDTWQPYKKMRNLDLPLRSSANPDDDPDLRFEPEKPSEDPTDSSMSYGLNLRENARENNESQSVVAERERSSKGPIEDVLLEKFKQDMKNLPAVEDGYEQFEEVPVEGFGAALLGAYGWKEGMGIGRKAKEDVKVVQYVRRAGREGLGFEPEVKEEGGGKVKEVFVAPKGADGRTRHVVSIDEKLVKRELRGVHVGKTVRVVGGRHVGVKGKVLEKLDDWVVVNLVKSDEEVRVRLDEVAEVGSVEEERCLKKLKELKKHEERKDSSSYRDGDDRRRRATKDREDKSSRRDGGSRREEEKRKPAISWLRSHIRVRIISKDIKGGKLYLKKGKVVDVVGPAVCDICMDDSMELIQSVHQDILETALPRRGGPVLVLSGKHKGVFGDLVEKNSEKETGVVRDADSHALLNVRLEQVAEYIGDPSLIGY